MTSVVPTGSTCISRLPSRSTRPTRSTPTGSSSVGPQRNRIPWICGIAGRQFVDGSTVKAGPCPAVDVSVLPPTIRFAPVSIGQGATRICTVVNLGREDATVRISASPGGSVFAWFPVTKTLARGEFVDVPIRFTPTRVLPAQATMTVTIEGGSSVRVGIAGQGKGPDPEPAPRIVAEPASVRFGSVILGKRATKTCTLVNRGDRAATIDVAGSPGGSAFAWFSVNARLAAGESVTIPIRFTPTGIGTARATLTVTVAGSAPIRVAVSGDGELGGPLIRVEPPELSLGQVQLGDSSTDEARIVNPSDDEPVTIRIDALSSGPIRWSAVSAQIPPNGSRTVPVTFRPTALGRVIATMSIAVTAPTAHVVRLSISGTGTGGPHIP